MTKRIPKQSRAIEKYERIIRTLSQIISEGNYPTTSTQKIAKQAGVGIGTLYEYFDSKEDILLSLFEAESRAVWAKIEQQVPIWLTMEPIVGLSEFTKQLVTVADDHKGLVKILLGQVPGLLSQEPMIRMLAQGELLLNLLMRSDPSYASSSKSDANAFIYLNALTGILLGVANGRPPSVSKQAIVDQITTMFVLIINNKDELM